MDGTRPDPVQLLARAQREESASRRGRLKLFFGAAPGVGKTYAMLSAAQRMAREGVDVVVGVVETHGRTETESVLLGLDVLPKRNVEYRGATLAEFDLDAALTRKPEILLIDELAHTNAPGGRFEKRWQDVEECLKAGINVYTTLNVQHIESLNDIVAQITGVSVKETVPDAVVEEAEEVELVDLPPEALLDRLKSGKVYVPQMAAQAVDSFFRRGNLTALRELALRRTAQWVDAQMREYKADRGIRAVWPAGERVLVAVSPSPMSAKLVRAAKRMAAGLHAELIAAYVETPSGTGMSGEDRERVMRTLRLAESLGAETATLSGSNAADELVSFARSRNVSKIVIGKTMRSRLAEAMFGSFVNSVIRRSGDIDVYVIRGDTEDAGPRERVFEPRATSRAASYGLAALLVAAMTALAGTVLGGLDLANVAMMYLGCVVVAAVWLGRGPAVLTAIASVFTFDFFFVPPKLSFSVSDAQYLVTFVVMLGVGLLIASLTTRLKALAGSARERERRTALLYAMARELSAAQDRREVAMVAAKHTREAFGGDAAVVIGVGAGAGTLGVEVLAVAGTPDWLDDREKGVARWTLDHGKNAGVGTQALPASQGRYVPLVASQGKVGVLALRPARAEDLIETSRLLLLETFANQIALALERVTLIEGQQAAKFEAERERLRSALLSSVSHDLRTPLASIAGAASTLEQAEGLDEATREQLTRGIVRESERLSDLIANLMFATRLDAGAVALKREWTTVEEIVGAGLARHREALASRPFRVLLPVKLPMVRVDNAMMPQVVQNLIENALRYTPGETAIEVSAWTTETHVVVRVADEGPGVADDELAKVFERFYRGRASKGAWEGAEAARGGMGLGLTICEGIVKAHGGRIWAEANRPRGVAFQFALPIEYPQPEMPVEASEAAT